MQCPECSAPASDLDVWKVATAGLSYRVYLAECRQCKWSVRGEIHNGYFVPFYFRVGADATSTDQTES